MQALTASLGLKEQVHFRGHISETNWVYDKVLAVINPSFIDSFGMTLIEAMARKTPVIATASGGPRRLLKME